MSDWEDVSNPRVFDERARQWSPFDQMYRMRVPGGWLYRYHHGTTTAIAMAFVPETKTPPPG